MADSSGAIARRYARALVSIGVEGNESELIAADLARFVAVLDQNGGMLRLALGNPGIPIEERRAVLQTVIGRLGLSPRAGNFLRLLLDKGRFGALGAILAQVQEMTDALSGQVRAKVRTATALSPGMEAEVQQALSAATGKTAILETAVDPSLIGGIVAQVGDKVYDASVRARLNSLYTTLAQRSAAEA
jgi:F-type H+-transporting ATPase subunit delta